MATDFSYGGKQILSSGPFRPSGKDMPNDARTRVETFADIATIPTPFVGMRITVLADETNNNKMTDYIVKTLKANSAGIANMLIDEVVRYVDYLGVNTSGSGTGLTTEQAQHLQTAYLHSQSTHVQASDIPNLEGYATETFVTNNYASKDHNHSEYAPKTHTHSEYANNSHRHDASEIDNLPSGGGTGLTSEQAQQLQTAYAHSQIPHIQQSDIPTKTSELENDSNFANQKYVDDRLIEISTSGVITEDITENDIYISGSLNNTDIVTDCLEGWWSPAVKVGQTLYDISGKGRNVTYPDDVVISNNKLSPDTDGSANVEIDIEPTEILTIEYVVNLTDNANGTPVMTYFYNKSAGMCISIASGRWFNVSVGYDSNSEGEDIPDNSVTLYSNGTVTMLWQPVAIGIHHVLLRYNSSLSRCEIFIDGQLSTAYKDLLGKKTPVFTVSKIAFNSRGIGINVSDSIRDMDIYDMKIYSKMLSDEEINKNYNSVKYIIEGQ